MSDGAGEDEPGAPLSRGALPSQRSPARGEGTHEIDWAEVRRAYELSEEPVASIRERFKLSDWQLRRRRVGERWAARPEVGKADVLRGKKPVGDEIIEFRLNRLIAVGLAMLEKRIAEEGPTEANARALTELTRAQEIRMRTKRNEKAAKAREKKNKDAGEDYRDDPEWLLSEIDRRLGRLAAGDKPGEAVGAPEDDPQGAGSAGA